METKALIVMGSMVAAGGLFGATLGVGKSIKGTIGMTAVGLGLGGFMAGLMAPGELTDFDGATTADATVTVSTVEDTLGGIPIITGFQGINSEDRVTTLKQVLQQ